MGKVRTRILGLEDIEMQQKEEQKKRSAEKKSNKPEEEVEGAESMEAATPKKAKPVKEVEGRNPKKGRSHGRSKNYKEATKKVKKDTTYSVKEAVELLKKTAYAKLPESVELHLNVDKTGVKGEVELPHATGKTVRVQIVDDKTLEAIEKGKLEFDVLIAHPSYMPKLARFAKVLGPKGLMPNPKSGTVSPNPEEVAKKFEKGTLQFKTESKFPIIHQMVAKLSSEDAQISENIMVFIQAVGKAHIKSVFIKTTMSPSLELDMNQFS